MPLQKSAPPDSTCGRIRRYFFLLEQGGTAVREVVLENRLWSNKRLVAIAELGGVIFAIYIGVVPVRRLRKFDAPGLSTLQVGDANLRQTLLPFVGNVIVLEEVRILEHDVGALRHDFLPILAGGIRDRRLDQAEIAPRVVHANKKEIAIVIRVVLDILLARLHQFPFRRGLIGGNVTSFAGGVAAGD